jgi:hypothetical protein
MNPLPIISESGLKVIPGPEYSLIRNNYQIYSDEIINEIGNKKDKKIKEDEYEEYQNKMGIKRRKEIMRNTIHLANKKNKKSSETKKEELFGEGSEDGPMENNEENEDVEMEGNDLKQINNDIDIDFSFD